MATNESTGLGESARAKLAGWLFSVAFVAHTVLIVIMPRLDKESLIRETARGWHYAIGIALIVFGAWRLWLWIKERGALGQDVLPPLARFWCNTLALATIVLVLIAGPLGFFYAWAEGRTINVAGLVAIPNLMSKDHAMWQFTGYFHSAFGNATLLLAIAGVLTAAYTYFRYGKGMFAAFPAGIGLVFLARTGIFIYALNSFRELRPGFIAAAIFLAVALAFWLIVRAVRSGKFAEIHQRAAPLAGKGVGGVALLAFVVFGLYMPHLMFRVTPFASGVVVEADPDITWHTERVAEVELSEPTEFDLTTGNETYKWCKFCHTMEPGGAHLVGPNLHNIFGQKAGTVPNFHYSPALAEAGNSGLVWTEESIIEYIAGPDQMVPGTSMIISRGPVTDPDVQRSVIESLKRDTMGEPSDGNE